ncbi:MAG: 16S rRNA (adenine(1518)-N(6)/adenine(1519)-N(6))-dimethyltransferase RsmA [Candidatus Krumholzibacteria bacterium]|jgi:16S rRNA (adenine1518-N6/adenine1519-N6)-dimethyltransferase|nr:16S rRNA (adenine(1518)-N(6)/adenine(1519)-N(6))-dimethyltransferase RsmA [Candidatus Krumholzibacteria bacterium]MDP6668945.1 16S rRNA (adenine(1518)-N(6)/adenine(1519)-N(6))-dimethyltransferase RsmA [Candidatus Krumholzibacteria bacterium]MDP6798126.1 16S rRNA (adenine(1518)-N(6)/adenine(1519)-N(6))-dimethyltransferase RsmA [Candidatus Krumholzibacteria bacterium]MDP7022351.1 16S rRNA (adenine(1518)-N(6)/adenine(1519)-N(6))-dimethyltransferase RsmA [Candidatus Krumholzibacteria bacterium]
MKEGRIPPLKRLGQNFLHDRRVIERILEALEASEGDFVLEYGCGTGALTRPLASSPARIVGVEVDRARLRELRGDEDFRNVEFREEGLEVLDPLSVACEYGVSSIKLLGNLPYQLTSTALFHCANGAGVLDRAVLMMQREVAHRVMASPGGRDYGILPALMQARLSVRKVVDASPAAFYPSPKVHSRVLCFRPLETSRVDDSLWDSYKALVKALFSERRKQMRSPLKKHYGLDDAGLEELTKRTGLDFRRRPETMEVEELALLTEKLPECAS